ncbi:calcium-binding protein SPEC 2D [Strongylocentrotus purpuratus]|uniref:EF-hand domain-containing protein n=1 Tax=Strongylocentrotus purpuratus TaxID=7668 RepID=A0A7M6UET9_STRPU|nr:calcium-binding protein SPEC 2D [Strongylocentrotus purpuratus]|eukprot:NP_999770.2 calcium-binding protein SPEC 2D [Strongylocentrotus purpuratus]
MAANLLFSEDQIKEYKTKFDAFDRNSDGNFPTMFLGNAMKSVGHVLTAAELENSRRDRKGTTTFPQFLAMILDKKCRKVFKAMDKDDKDKLLSADEVRQAMLSFDRQITEDKIKEMIEKADFTNDGKCSLEEFVKMMMNFC